MEIANQLNPLPETGNGLTSTPAVAAFLPSEALGSLHAGMLDADAVRTWVLRRMHPEGARCPECGAPARVAQEAAFWARGRVECPECRRWYTASSGTMLHGCKLDIRKLYLIAVCLGAGLPGRQVAEISGVSQETVRVWAGRFGQLECIMGAGR